jgi:DNA-binding transcriptional MerR regulator
VPLSRARDYLSIGEVLETIRAEFPEVSISKIRFLENEGLITPERTASGYRKFYAPDVARLRHILALQRDHFLPLKVIKQRLSEMPDDGDAPGEPLIQAGGVERSAGEEDTDRRLTRAELQQRAGVSEGHLRELETYGILERKPDASYDAEDLEITRAATGLVAFGVEARHMRMFRQTAERERALIDQIVAPLRHRRDPEARRETQDSVRKLAELTGRLREAVIRSSLRELL